MIFLIQSLTSNIAEYFSYLKFLNTRFSEEPSEKSDMCGTITEDMRYTISFDPGT